MLLKTKTGATLGFPGAAPVFGEESFDCILGWCYLHLWIDYAQIIPQPCGQSRHGQDDQSVSVPDTVMVKEPVSEPSSWRVTVLSVNTTIRLVRIEWSVLSNP